MKSIIVTDHAYDRLKERNNWSRGTVDRMAPKIFKLGVRAHEVKGYLKAWVEKKQAEAKNDEIYLLYGDIVYLYHSPTDRAAKLITAFSAPTKNALDRIKNGQRRSERTRQPLKARKHMCA